jgi:integrase
MRSAVARQPEIHVEVEFQKTDFSLSEEEVAKGAQAVCSYLESIKPDDSRKSAAEALDMLALVISDGICSSREFPWHQVRAHHGTAAFTILKETGTPAKVEGYLCQKDQSRRSRRTPEAYPTTQVQKARHSLRRLLAECNSLGFVDAEEGNRTMELLKSSSDRVVRGRMITDGEFRALVSVCQLDTSPSGLRDGLLIRLGYQGGLRLSELVALSIEDLHFDMETNTVSLDVRGTKAVQKRSVEIGNQALIAVEDWLEACEASEGPLLRPIRRGKLDDKRLKGADVRLVCERRAEQAAVELFSPQDLRRRVAAGRPAGLYASGLEAPHGILAQFGSEDRDPPETLAFPYPVRSQSQA